MRNLPSGTVTLLFTDMEGSTRLLYELGERYADVLAQHRRVLRDVFERHAGVEVDTQGDAFFAAFARATDAVAAARDAQAALGDAPVRVRIGIHTGEPLVTDEGYVGLDVHRAARIMGAAHGGQVLLSETTRRLLHAASPLRDLGEHRLKDLTAPQRLYQLGDDAFPPLKALYRTTLPVQPWAVVGRKRELEEGGALLRAHRLVTLTGPGGSGKTRLALQLAADASEGFPDGVFWVPLQALRDPDLVERAIAASVGAPDNGLIEHVSDKCLLLLLDNFEQVMDAASTVASLLVGTPNAKVLITSREPLRVGFERRYAVEPLPAEDAVTLFVERAQSVRRGFRVTPAVGQICRRLDGLPLAVELAAARVALLEPDELLARLERTLPLLISGFRDAPERQRTLRATIDWSYNLLDPLEQEAFRRVAVFSGTFSLDAAEAVCGARIDLIESLVVKSLVRRWGSGRLGLLDTIREYALERLEESTEADEIRSRHAQFFLNLAESANLNPSTYDPTKPIRHDLARMEQNEIHGALAWALQTASVTYGLRLASAVGGWLWSIDHPEEGVRYFDRLLRNANLDSIPLEILADALREHAAQAFLANDNAKSERLAEQSLALYGRLGDEHGRAVMLHRLGLSALHAGRLQHARSLIGESHAIHQHRDDQWGLSQTLGALGAVARDAGDDALAHDLLTESAGIAREIGGGFAGWWASGTLAELACLSLNAGRLDEAETYARQALALAEELYDRAGRILGVGVLAAIAASRGQLARAGHLWTAVAQEDAVAPLGGWRRHRQECEALVRRGSGLGFDPAQAAETSLTLDDAVRMVLLDERSGMADAERRA